MIIGKKDRAYVKDLETTVSGYNKSIAKEVINYLKETEGISYAEIARQLGCSQSYINNLALGKLQITNDKFSALIAKLFKGTN